MTDVELLSDVAALEALAGDWDALAVAASNPVLAPAWTLAWWRFLADPEQQPRVVAVRDRGELIGLAPFYLSAGRHGVRECRLMGDDFGVCEQPLALPGREWDVAGGIASALAESEPAPDMLAFGPMTLASNWISGLREQWPGKVVPLARQQRVESAPVVLLGDGGYEQWFASLSSKLRHTLRRSERQFAAAGGTVRWSDARTLRSDAQAFARLHGARWEGRGWSRLSDLGERLPDWLEHLAAPLLEQGRFHMCVLELDGEAICVDFGLSAGSEVAAVNVGWDERHAKLAPAKLAVMRVVENAHRLGCERVHLGCGEQQNKLRLANGNDPVGWTVLMTPSARLPRTYGVALPGLLRGHARDAAERALPPERVQRLRGLRG